MTPALLQGWSAVASPYCGVQHFHVSLCAQLRKLRPARCEDMLLKLAQQASCDSGFHQNIPKAWQDAVLLLATASTTVIELLLPSLSSVRMSVLHARSCISASKLLVSFVAESSFFSPHTQANFEIHRMTSDQGPVGSHHHH